MWSKREGGRPPLVAALSFVRAPAVKPGQGKTLLGWWTSLHQGQNVQPLPCQSDCGSIDPQDVDGAEAPPVDGTTEGSGRPVMEHEPGEDSFLALCERLFALSLEQAALLTRATEARGSCDQDAMDEVAEAIEANTVERRLALWRLYELANSAKR